MPRGGARVGAGRPRKDAAAKWLGGNAGKRKATDAPRSQPTPLLPAPADVPAAQAAVWAQLAPHACQARTLVAGTAQAFADLCEAIVLKRMMLAEILADGLTGTKVTLQMDETGGGLQSVEKKAHALLSQYRAMVQRVDVGMKSFRLSPMGKELALPAEAPKDEWAEFETVN